MRKRKALRLLNCSIKETDEMRWAADILAKSCNALEEQIAKVRATLDERDSERAGLKEEYDATAAECQRLSAKLTATEKLVDRSIEAGRELVEQRDGAKHAFWALMSLYAPLCNKYADARKKIASLEAEQTHLVAAADKDALRASHPPLEGVCCFTDREGNDLLWRMTVRHGNLVGLAYKDGEWADIDLDIGDVVPSTVWAAYQEGWRDARGEPGLRAGGGVQA